MSIKRLNSEEKARYLIGIAIVRQFREAPRDPDTVKDMAVVSRWIEHWLTSDELADVMSGSGIIFDAELADKLDGLLDFNRKRPPSGKYDDGTPF